MLLELVSEQVDSIIHLKSNLIGVLALRLVMLIEKKNVAVQ